MRLPVFDANGKRTQEILEFDEKIFGDRVHRVVLKNAILMYEARQRAGTHATKTRAECSGSGRKLWRQKGTGRARVGPSRPPHWRGGGTVFGPHPRDYSYSMPKKAKRKALDSAWLAKFLDKEIMVIEGFDLPETPKTASVYATLQEMRVGGKRVLVGTNAENQLLYKSLRNLPRVSMETVARFNPYILLAHDRVVLLKDALVKLVEEKGGTLNILARNEAYKK